MAVSVVFGPQYVTGGLILGLQYPVAFFKDPVPPALAGGGGSYADRNRRLRLLAQAAAAEEAESLELAEVLVALAAAGVFD